MQHKLSSKGSSFGPACCPMHMMLTKLFHAALRGHWRQNCETMRKGITSRNMLELEKRILRARLRVRIC